MRRVAYLATKPEERYRGIRIHADTGLHEQLASIVRSVAPAGSRILDFGAGAGALSQRLADLGYDVLAADIDGAGFRADVPFEQLDFNDPARAAAFLERHRDAFDLVLGVEVIEHLENPWQFLRDMRGIARPGGHLLVTTPNVTSWYSRVNFLLRGRFHQFEDSDREYGHINPVCEDELRLIAGRLGLEVVRTSPGGWLPRVWITPYARESARNLFGFLLSPFMEGTRDGWCLVMLLRKPSEAAGR